MISFKLSDEQKSIRAMARKFAVEVVRPRAAEHDANGTFPHDEVKLAHELGITTSIIPKEYGGLGLPMLEQVLIDEELGWACKGFFAAGVLPQHLGLTPLILFGTPEQKKRFLPSFIAEVKLCSFALTEPSGGSDLSALSTTAVKRGDEYILTGEKCFISNAGLAQLFTVFARVSDGKSNPGGLTAFLVPRDTPGLSVGPNEVKMGSKCADTRSVSLRECVVPADLRVGAEGRALEIADRCLSRGRPKVAAAATGIQRAALDYATKYAMERRTGSKKLIQHQLIQVKLAEMAKDLVASRLLVWNACWLLDNDLPARLEISAAKCFATDAAVRTATEAIQVLGGNGYMRGYGVEKLLRDAKVGQIGEGTNEIQRLLIASETVRRIATGLDI
jgi:acyl-CoA dehydrogenase